MNGNNKTGGMKMERWLNKSKLIDPYKVFSSAEEAARHIDPDMDEPETVRLITKEQSEEYERLREFKKQYDAEQGAKVNSF